MVVALKKFEWSNYELSRAPTIELGDYKIKAYGRDEEIAAFVSEYADYSAKSTRLMCRLLAYWGTGKSTYLYNLCHRVNERLFFGDEIENPKTGDFTHALAFFEKLAVKRAKLVECVYNDGLPWPWDTKTPRNVAPEMGKEAWRECLRKLAHIILRRSVFEIKRKHLEETALGGSKLRKDVLEYVASSAEVKTSELIQNMAKEYKSNDQFFDECGELMRYYIRMLLPSIETRKGNRKIVSQETFEQQFPLFLYPCDSSKFLGAYKELFPSDPDMNLRFFPAFEKILKAARTFLLLAFDEVEDWSLVTKDKIDNDLHDIAVDAESQLSLVLIVRTDTLRYIKSELAYGTYMTIFDRLENLRMRPLSTESIKNLTAEILSTARDGEPKIFPLTEDFIGKLASMTKRAGAFNIRTYLRALKMLLPESLEWKREKPELTADLLEQKKADELVNEAIKAEEKEAKFVAAQPPKRFEA